MPFPTIKTDRLLLREIVRTDAPDLFAVHGDPNAMRWFGSDPILDEAAAEKLVEVFASWRSLPSPGTRWGIQRYGQSSLIGTCGLFAWNRNWRKCTVGYELNPKAQGSGLMHEALVAVLSWGFEHMQLNRIEAQVHPANTSSLRSLARLGFKQEGLLRELGFWGNRFHDMYQYSLLRAEWERGVA